MIEITKTPAPPPPTPPMGVTITMTMEEARNLVYLAGFNMSIPELVHQEDKARICKLLDDIRRAWLLAGCV